MLTVFEHFMLQAPAPAEDIINLRMAADKSANPYNDSRKPELRSREEIILDHQMEWALAALHRMDVWLKKRPTVSGVYGETNLEAVTSRGGLRPVYERIVHHHSFPLEK